MVISFKIGSYYVAQASKDLLQLPQCWNSRYMLLPYLMNSDQLKDRVSL